MTTSAGAQQLVEMPHQLVDRHCRGIGSRGLYSALLLSAALLHHLFRRAELTISLHLLVDCLASPGVAGGQILVTVAQIHVHEKAKLFPMTLAVALSLVGSLPCLTYLQRSPPFPSREDLKLYLKEGVFRRLSHSCWKIFQGLCVVGRLSSQA